MKLTINNKGKTLANVVWLKNPMDKWRNDKITIKLANYTTTKRSYAINLTEYKLHEYTISEIKRCENKRKTD